MQDIQVRSNGSPEGDAFLALWYEIGKDMRQEEKAWCEFLIGQGIQAAHPDDGWVNFQAKMYHRVPQPPYTVQFVYPQFYHAPKVGSLVALGTPRAYRVVRLTGFEDSRFGGGRVWTFEVVQEGLTKSDWFQA